MREVEGLKCLRLGDGELGEFEQIDLPYEIKMEQMYKLAEAEKDGSTLSQKKGIYIERSKKRYYR